MRNRQNIISAALLSLSLIVWVYAMIDGRWESFSSLPLFFVGIGIWITWVVHLGRISIRQARKHRAAIGGFTLFFCVLFGAFIVFIVVWLLSFGVGRAICVHEVQKAVDAGLRNDCLKLLKNWPTKDDRIYLSHSEFSTLAPSIRMLSPLYVKNDYTDNTNVPPNIGICKNGFGGFVCGIRVFQNDEDATNYFSPASQYDRYRVAPGIYALWGPM
jgi:hypothetical protein